MHRAIGYISKCFVRIRPGEENKTYLTFFYFFLVITAYYVIKPVSRSLVLGELGSRMVPYVDLICVVVMGPVVALFARLVDRLKKQQLVACSFWFVTAVLLLFWKLLSFKAPWIAGAFYVWVSVLSVLVVTLFWLVANDLFHPREAKRLFGFIGSGGILGGIAGSAIAAFGARALGTEHLLLLSAVLLIGSWLLVERLWVYSIEPPSDGISKSKAPRENFFSDPSGFLGLLFQSRYLLLLVALVGLAKVISTLVYYQFNPFLENAFPDLDARTAFTGLFFGGMNIAAFIIQFGFTSFVLRRLGLRAALFTLPVGLCIGTIALLGWPGLWLVAGLELYDGAMNYSLQQTAKEVLYLPIDRSIRYKVKPFIDMVVFRFGKGIAAVIGILLLHGLHVQPQTLGYLSIPLIGVWMLVAVWLARDYVATIRTSLQARAALRRVQLSAGTGQWGELFGSLTDLPPAAKKLSLIDQLVATKEAAPLHVKDFLAELMAQETFSGNSAELGVEVHRLKAIVSDGSVAMAMRRQAIRLLARLSDQAIVDYLFGLLLVEEDLALRQEAVIGLIKLRLKRRSLEFPAKPIRRLVGYEVENYQRIIAVASIYRKHCRGALALDDPALALLKTLLEESVEQVFRMLMLLHRPEDVHLVYEQMQAPDAHLRADALELLDNLVDPAMRSILLPILDEDRFLSVLDEASSLAHEPTTAYRILQEAIWDHNYWLSITTLCAVGRLRLTSMRQELEKASRHSRRLLSSAAKTALYLATRS